jgi:hypothetical protein
LAILVTKYTIHRVEGMVFCFSIWTREKGGTIAFVFYPYKMIFLVDVWNADFYLPDLKSAVIVLKMLYTTPVEVLSTTHLLPALLGWDVCPLISWITLTR